MDIGLYNLKYPFRKMIDGVLPLVKNVNPNTVSWLLIPVGIGIAYSYYIGANGAHWLYLVAIGLTFLRMFLGTLDGLMAEHFEKGSPAGEIINRLTPEICDVLYIAAITLAKPEWFLLGVGVLSIAWLTTFAGLVGLAINKPIQSVGPVGQTDRLAALLIFTLLAFFSEASGWGIDFIKIFLYWAIFGGLLTILLRLGRTFKKA